ncbi:hypothetical protein DSU70_07875, partial [Campylobacter jejuni]|nr:hypothetical protein [Campylobacter jejuni]EAI2629693.1 hypothetical protein [Campylobacter jejuni]EAL3718098.1 hypothetical protein [Campylobacter jejuni]EAL4194492.1 hypothetical protein [Campylobacter jejuni]EAL5120610.1 hypothetical protein [Campylobacter jejuni]
QLWNTYCSLLRKQKNKNHFLYFYTNTIILKSTGKDYRIVFNRILIKAHIIFNRILRNMFIGILIGF